MSKEIQVEQRPSETERPSATPPRRELSGSELLFGQERRDELRQAWRDVQTSFIDEPRGAVRNADALVKEVLSSISHSFENARRELEAGWGEAEEASTESLRLALQRYRALFERLLAS
ncbi:MAG TPA: hypothetical protein VKA01_06010 [Vicinamibacteria bacterium]|nr:hypothetical protein [Vicinamibacteria bacterium]